MKTNISGNTEAGKKRPSGRNHQEHRFFRKQSAVSIPLSDRSLLLNYSAGDSSLSAALVEKPRKTSDAWKTIWKSRQRIRPVRISRSKDMLRFYFRQGRSVRSIRLSLQRILEELQPPAVTLERKILLQRVPGNPIIRPSRENRWESDAVFNAAALYLEGKVHFIYRAVGESGLSVFGYAASENGTQVHERASSPVFVGEKITAPEAKLTPYPYGSGGSWCGCEDPRLTRVGETIYMTYTAFDGCSPPCVALTSIGVGDFLEKNWNWQKPRLISPPGKMNKNWVVFPEKIDGKFAVLHSITPDIRIEYVDSLEPEEDRFIESYYHSKGREAHWDNWVRGVGPPPIRTREGWLVLYHAMDRNDPDRYKIGAMILDADEPEKILHRSTSPLLEPDHWYENDGHKRGVVYSCGAAVIGGKLLVYYGGSDNFLCAAMADLDTLLHELKTSGAPRMQPLSTKHSL